MDTNRLPKQALQYKPKGRRNIGRPRKRWRNQLHLEDQGRGNTPNPSGAWWWWSIYNRVGLQLTIYMLLPCKRVTVKLSIRILPQKVADVTLHTVDSYLLGCYAALPKVWPKLPEFLDLQRHRNENWKSRLTHCFDVTHSSVNEERKQLLRRWEERI